MSDISEQEPSKMIGELSKALSSEVRKTERVSKHCSKIDTTSPAEKEERSVNKSPSREINAEDDRIFVKADILRPSFLRGFVVYSNPHNKNKNSTICNSERIV